MRICPISVVALVVAAGTCFADEGLPLETLTALKEATVFVKMEAGRHSASGSGFVVAVEAGTGYVVTNHHVVNPTIKVALQDRMGPRPVVPPPPFGPPPGILVPPSPFGPSPGVPLPAQPPKTVEITLRDTTVTLVFGSGTDKEQSARAEVVAADAEFDLAVLKVSSIKNLPRPIEIGQVPELVETMPVYVFGFPYGKKLSTTKGNPAITVGKGSVSSIRKDDKGAVAVVQIDGALNPGNSGGPVVDAKGRLVGVAVATIKGSGIGLAIPPNQLQQTLQGRPGNCRLRANRVQDACVVTVEVDLIDPMSKLKSVAFHFVRTDSLKEKLPKTGIEGIAQTRAVDLKIEAGKATGQFTLDVPVKEQVSITYQTSARGGKDKGAQTEPLAFIARPEGLEDAFKPPVLPPLTPPLPVPDRPLQGNNEKTNKNNYDKIDNGMTEEQVAKVLGNPTITTDIGNRKRSVWHVPGGGAFIVDFRDGKSVHKSRLGFDGPALAQPNLQVPDLPMLGKNQKISKENFNKVEDGMTEEQVKIIFGNPTSAFERNNSRTLTWMDPFGIVTVEFRDGKSVHKTQLGLDRLR